MFRIQPQGPPGAYKTYQIVSPLNTHARPASCAEVECGPYLRGWTTHVPPGATDLADLILSGTHGRHFTEITENPAEGRSFLFGPGQMCFAAETHQVSLERPAFFRVKGGDWRRDEGVIRKHVNAADWVEDFAEHQDKVASVVNRG